MNRSMWWINSEEPESRPFEQTVYIIEGGALESTKPECLVMAAIIPTVVDESIGAMLVPPAFAYSVSHNGQPLPPGVYSLRHSDEIVVEGRTYWVARSASVECTSYEPELHGENVFCFATKARLSPRQAIAICPGTGGSPCGVIYKKEAWEIANQRSASRCPSCGFDPNETEWHPPVRKPDRLLPRLMAMVARRN